MNELFNEIEDDIRQENLDRLWQRAGKFMVVVSAAVIAVTVAVVIMQNRSQTRAIERTGRFIEGTGRLDAGDFKGAIAAFGALAEGGNSAYYGMAMLRKAQAQAAAGDKQGAAETYAALAAHNGTFGALAEMQVGGTDKIIMPDRSSPFYYTLSEWRGWQLLRAGKKDEAVKQFLAVRNDVEAPFSLRQRMGDVAQQLASGETMSDEQMSGKQIKDKK